MTNQERKAIKDEIRLHQISIAKLSNTSVTSLIIRRVLISPFIFGVSLVGAISISFIRTYKFVIYGGEMFIYGKTTTKNIASIYEKLEEQNKL